MVWILELLLSLRLEFITVPIQICSKTQYLDVKVQKKCITRTVIKFEARSHIIFMPVPQYLAYKMTKKRQRFFIIHVPLALRCVCKMGSKKTLSSKKNSSEVIRSAFFSVLINISCRSICMKTLFFRSGLSRYTHDTDIIDRPPEFLTTAEPAGAHEFFIRLSFS